MQFTIRATSPSAALKLLEPNSAVSSRPRPSSVSRVACVKQSASMRSVSSAGSFASWKRLKCLKLPTSAVSRFSDAQFDTAKRPSAAEKLPAPTHTDCSAGMSDRVTAVVFRNEPSFSVRRRRETALVSSNRAAGWKARRPTYSSSSDSTPSSTSAFASRKEWSPNVRFFSSVRRVRSRASALWKQSAPNATLSRNSVPLKSNVKLDMTPSPTLRSVIASQCVRRNSPLPCAKLLAPIVRLFSAGRPFTLNCSVLAKLCEPIVMLFRTGRLLRSSRVTLAKLCEPIAMLFSAGRAVR